MLVAHTFNFNTLEAEARQISVSSRTVRATYWDSVLKKQTTKQNKKANSNNKGEKEKEKNLT